VAEGGIEPLAGTMMGTELITQRPEVQILPPQRAVEIAIEESEEEAMTFVRERSHQLPRQHPRRRR